jgi:peptidoglycan/LPS O-acetylase OafA/YrhL
VGLLLAWTRWGTTSAAERVLCIGLAMVILAQKDRALAVAAGAILLCDFGAEHSVAGQLGAARKIVAGFLSCGVMRKMADWSYGIFLVHPLIVPVVLIYLAAHTHISQAAPALRFLTLGLPVFLLSTLAAAALHRLIEVPGIRLGRWLEQRLVRLDAESDATITPEPYLPGLSS